MPRPGLNYGEAFCLMKYAKVEINKHGIKPPTDIEWIWNSRDGVTPMFLGINTPDKLSHVDWHEDAFMPNYVPLVGSRVFVGASEEPSVVTVTEEMRAEFKRLAIEDPYTVDKGVIIRRSMVKRI